MEGRARGERGGEGVSEVQGRADAGGRRGEAEGRGRIAARRGRRARRIVGRRRERGSGPRGCGQQKTGPVSGGAGSGAGPPSMGRRACFLRVGAWGEARHLPGAGCGALERKHLPGAQAQRRAILHGVAAGRAASAGRRRERGSGPRGGQQKTGPERGPETGQGRLPWGGGPAFCVWGHGGQAARSARAQAPARRRRPGPRRPSRRARR